MKLHAVIPLSILLLLFGCGQSADKEQTAAPIEAAAATGEKPREHVALEPLKTVDGASIEAGRLDSWLSHGRTYSEQRFMPLDQINLKNIEQLGLDWFFDLDTNRGVEATPIIHNGVMYVSAPWNIVFALDARTGKQLWTFDPVVDKEQAANGCCDMVNRGVAIWGDAIFIGTLDGRLISLDAASGVKNWDVLTIDKSKPYTITGAPRIIKGKVIIGNGGAELGVRGYVSAYDANSGEMIWRFYTVPGNPAEDAENAAMEMAAKTWTGDTYWKVGGGGTVWDSMAYDPSLNLLYIGVGNGSPWNHEIRSPQGGDNLFLSSIVALKPETGEYVWHYQTTPADSWDYTATQHMILADLEIEQEKRQVIMQAPKNGFFYVLDRKTGELISANNFVDVNWATNVDMKTGRPVVTKLAQYGEMPTGIQLPGPVGAHNWQPMSFSPDTGLVYIPAQAMPWAYAKNPDFEYKPGGWNTGNNDFFNALPTNKAIMRAVRAALKGTLIAWDPVKQEAAWSHEHKGPWNGGVLATAGGLVFQGTADATFAAFDATTGEKKWSFPTQTGVMSGPVSYQLDGEQYVAVTAGWGGVYGLSIGGVLPSGSRTNAARVLVFKLGAGNTLPDLPQEDVVTREPPELLEVSAETLKLGKERYFSNCSLCHGNQAFSSGLVPNLRYSAITPNAEAWSAIVLNGALIKQGMPNFEGRLSSDEVEAIRAYVISEANSDRDKAFYDSLVKK